MSVTFEPWPCCGQPRGQGVPSCTVKTVEIPGDDADEILPSVPYAPDYGGEGQRCHDCGVARGGYHHPGCDMERCPKCEGQLIGCGCLSDYAYNAWQRAKNERDRLRHALVTRGGLDHLAQCPSCLAERTNGERHDDDCPLMLLVDSIRQGQ